MTRWRGAALFEFVLSWGAYGAVLAVVIGAGAALYASKADSDLRAAVGALAQDIPELYVARADYTGITGEAIAESGLFGDQRAGACARATAGDCWLTLPADDIKVALGPGGGTELGRMGAGSAAAFVMRLSALSQDTAAGALDVADCTVIASGAYPRLVGGWVDGEPAASPNQTGGLIPATTATTGPSKTDTVDHVWRGTSPSPADAQQRCEAASAGTSSATLYLAFR